MARNPFGSGVKCSRIAIILLNVIFLLLGIALFVLGLIFRFGGNQLKEDIKPSLDKASVNDFNLYDLLGSLSILFIIVGAIIIGFSILGFIGAVCYVRAVLITYAILVGLLLAVELAGVILFFAIRTKLSDAVKTSMKDSIIQANNNSTDTQKQYTTTESLFTVFKCCHVDEVRYNQTSVCKQESNANYMKDCYTSFSDWVKEYQMALVGICIAVMVTQLLLIICACCICQAVRKSEEIV